MISCLFLKAYLNSLVYRRNIFGSSSKVFCNLRKFSGIFGMLGHSRNMSRKRLSGLGTILENLRKSLEGCRKSSENHQKRRNQYVYIIGTFRSEDEDDYEYEFSVLSTRTSKNVGLQTSCACSLRKTRTRSRPRSTI